MKKNVVLVKIYAKKGKKIKVPNTKYMTAEK